MRLLFPTAIRWQESLRGAGIAKLRLGDYQGAVESFTQALSQNRVKKSIRQDLLAYRATAQLKAGLPDDAMATVRLWRLIIP